ncbi:hypothetical protein Kfla_1049 [Kribbella flavida DSM 17836]|uniref:Uncharacterized protein n=1 Tax=Kribbella flavida (strain DSM 17836 / JCM 10339 / NBRC 14399) TaxID=479435 RepID=D2Q1G5_KRIFD|nr:hypothetical protein [Kribbella flavida]ADB30153.1 hypothetical protein Kfla_1049 [Kribbella flavida DSM 17836]
MNKSSAKGSTRLVAVALTGAAIAGLLVGVNVLTARESATADAEPPVAARVASSKDGWRWETYGTVQLQVPKSWRQELWAGPPQCPEHDREPAPVVLRPGGARLAMLITCQSPTPTVHQIAPSVIFGGTEAGLARLADGWIRETRTIGGQLITVTTGDNDLRQRIFASAGVIGAVDSYGCDPRTALARAEVLRPPFQGGLKAVGTVTSVSVCRYSTGRPELLSSSRLTGAAAQRLTRDLIAAPAGTGPTVTESRLCGTDPGGEVIILRVHGTNRNQDVIYRHGGCRHNGTDDGSTLRRLTPATARQIFIGIHLPNGVTNVLHQLLIGTPPPVY